MHYSIPGDMSRVEDDGTITLLGRVFDCINTGGEKLLVADLFTDASRSRKGM